MVGGAFIGSWVSKSLAESAKKSRAEIDDPEQAEEACEDIAGLLNEWLPMASYETEDHFTEDLAAFLEENTDWEIEVYPNSPEGKPDILIGDLLALELKIGLGKAQRDRLIGQCAGYSRLWVTWAVIIGATESELGRLVDLLEDKGLDHIAVWGF
jgi:hypothetical protein